MKSVTSISIFAWVFALAFKAMAADDTEAGIATHFDSTVKPFLQTYCVTCHGREKPEADLNLAAYSSMGVVAKNGDRLGLIVERLAAEEMPPRKAKIFPAPAARRQAIEWFQSLRDFETLRNAGDPGVVLARRLSNAEYDYTIRDLTGVDLKPTREFPVDPSNIAGFDNSGESLVMSPALLKKYLAAAREIADHLYLKPGGFGFAPYPMRVETDRDKFCVQQIIDFYHRQDIDYADYFQAAWRFKYRATLGQPSATLAEIAAENKVSAKYLATIWSTLAGAKADAGPLVKLQSLWIALPVPDAGNPKIARQGCEDMRAYVIAVRQKVEMRFLNITAGKINASRQPLLIWKDIQYATHRRKFDPAQLKVADEKPPVPADAADEPGADGAFGPGHTLLVTNAPNDPDLAVPADERARYEAAFAKFCSVFPDMFYKQERGRNYFDTSKDQGRYLSAGFHNVMGYFRDDEPLYELILDNAQEKELDEMWQEMDFVAQTNERMYAQFASSGEARGRVTMDTNDVAEGAQPADKEVTSQAKIRQLEKAYLAMTAGGSAVGIKAVKDYFEWVDATVRRVEKARVDAEPSHLAALLQFAACAYRHPLANKDKNDLLSFYRDCRAKEAMSHEDAMRECVVYVLMSPDTAYRVDLAGAGNEIRPLSDYELASRLSYFLWSSIPDDELLAHAARGDLHQPQVIAAEARRMLKDSRSRALAVEFGGNWLDFRRFEDIGTVDLQRFPNFTSDLRNAMFEEPVRFLCDVFQTDRSVLDLLYANDTFVNSVLAKHYGIEVAIPGSNGWVHVSDVSAQSRGGILPMAVFLTKNAPGLRTSPVKRGNWVVKNVLGERIPPPPAVVPELPHDEAKLDLPLRDMLARHRADANCAVCHARFDSMGLVFEGFGPVGERREKDLGGRPIDAHAVFPGGGEGEGLAGLRAYIREKRQNDFVDNLCGKLLVYALGRSVMLSDEPLVKDMHAKLAADDYRFETLIESIVTSKQFLTKRGSDYLAATEK